MKSLAEQSRKSLEDFKASLTENDKKYFEEVALPDARPSSS